MHFPHIENAIICSPNKLYAITIGFSSYARVWRFENGKYFLAKEIPN